MRRKDAEEEEEDEEVEEEKERRVDEEGGQSQAKREEGGHGREGRGRTRTDGRTGGAANSPKACVPPPSVQMQLQLSRTAASQAGRDSSRPGATRE